ncbi:deaminase, partial [Pantoea sp. CTOTU49201]|uniref:deaminase n=1 Tax=Pantoea sp. CTOTU49201 TaxID=2953855 RepID=UPI00289B778D
EILAIREACRESGSENLTDCDIYILASPCPMCLGALYYCSPKQVIYITKREEYSTYYRDDRKYFELDTFYDEYSKPIEQRRLPMKYDPRPQALDVYKRWQILNK